MNNAGWSVGHTVTAYNRTTTKALPLRAYGITVVTRPEQAMAQADCVILMLADAVAIRTVLLTPASLAVLRDKTVIQMGTIAQEESLACRLRSNESADRIARRRRWEALPKHQPEHSSSWSAGPKDSLSSGVSCSAR